MQRHRKLLHAKQKEIKKIDIQWYVRWSLNGVQWRASNPVGHEIDKRSTVGSRTAAKRDRLAEERVAAGP